MGRAATRLLVYAGILAVGVGTASVVFAGPPKVSQGKRVFLLGDSLAQGLSRPLSALAKDHKVEFKSLAVQGSRIDNWSSNQAMYAAMKLFKPDLILVSLGTNDEFLSGDGGTRQAQHLQTLLSNLRAIAPVVWIGPPKLPKNDTNGVIPLIVKSVPNNYYFPSQELDIPRAPDKLHPTAEGYAGWAAKIWKWMT